MSDKIQLQVEKFGKEWQQISMMYGDYARSVGLNYTSLQILKYITEIDNCTQKIIADLTFLPKQTINTVVTNFYKNGYIELHELAENRRIKTIHLTQKGKEYSESISKKLKEAEYKTMEQLSENQRDMLIESISAYRELFCSILSNDK